MVEAGTTKALRLSMISQHMWDHVTIAVGDNPCWMYRNVPTRYGPHKRFYEALTGEADLEGMHLHHICGHSRCVNPLHLQPLTPTENLHNREWKELVRSSEYKKKMSDQMKRIAKEHPHWGGSKTCVDDCRCRRHKSAEKILG